MGVTRLAPLLNGYLERSAKQGYLSITSPQEAFGLFYGLVIQDLQIRVLLGDAPPSDEVIKAHVQFAVDTFIRLCSRDASSVSL